MADTMQIEAMERLKQMYSKAQPSNANENKAQSFEKSQKAQKPEPIEEKEPINKSENLLDIFMRDKEKSLIVLLIVILLSEKADTSLILALMYLFI